MAFNSKSATALLNQLGIRGGLQDLVRKAIIQGWSADMFADALIHTKQFKQAFPGLVQNGGIAIDFGGGAGASSLVQAVSRYRQGFDDFQGVAKDLGMNGFNKQGFALAIKNEISLDEYAARLQVEKTVRDNQQLLGAFNEQLKLMGKKSLDEMGWKKFLAKAGSSDLYDAYEAAYLKTSGLNISAEQAQGIAKNIGAPGQPGTDLAGLVAFVNQIKPDIAPELARAGITDSDLVQLRAGVDPKNQAPLLQQLVDRRRALGQQRQNAYSSTSDSGGFSLYQEDQAAAY